MSKNQTITPLHDLIRHVDELKMDNLKAIGKAVSPKQRKALSGASTFYNSISHYLKQLKEVNNG